MIFASKSPRLVPAASSVYSTPVSSAFLAASLSSSNALMLKLTLPFATFMILTVPVLLLSQHLLEILLSSGLTVKYELIH